MQVNAGSLGKWNARHRCLCHAEGSGSWFAPEGAVDFVEQDTMMEPRHFCSKLLQKLESGYAAAKACMYPKPGRF
jgi:hypothetical protein